MTSSDKDAQPAYWDRYSNHQHTKHQLIRNYLNGWFPKLGKWSGRVLYIDTHAGKGRYLSGEFGSPLVAAKALLDHGARDSILKKSKVDFFFFEHDPDNCKSLRRELHELGTLPDRMRVFIENGDCFEIIDELLSVLERENKRMAPAFLFVDPYGFKVPGSLLKRLMAFPRVELFLNVIWRELNMGMSQAEEGNAGMQRTIDLVFGGEDWRTAVDSADFEARVEKAASLFKSLTNAKWGTFIRMLGKNGVTRYFLLHLSNHDAGRDLMKDCIWSACPEGGFHANRLGDGGQGYLIAPEPDLTPLRIWIIERLTAAPTRWLDLLDQIRPELWRGPQLNKLISKLRKEKIIEATDYIGKFTKKANPLLSVCSADGGTDSD